MKGVPVELILSISFRMRGWRYMVTSLQAWYEVGIQPAGNVSQNNRLVLCKDLLGSEDHYDTPISASSPLYYVSHLTSLLESIALIIDQHQNIVDKYYGQGKMKVVVQRLQVEADGFCKTLVEGWEDERRVGRLVSSCVLLESSRDSRRRTNRIIFL